VQKREVIQSGIEIVWKIDMDYKASNEEPTVYFSRVAFYEKDCRYSIAVHMFTKVIKRYPKSLWFPQYVERCFQIVKNFRRVHGPAISKRFPDSAISILR
jgi:hypothetical protein